MTRKCIFQIITTLSVLITSSSSLFAQTYLNLGFETVNGKKVDKWFPGNELAEYSIDSLTKKSGKYSFKINLQKNTHNIDAFMRSEIPVSLVKGKKLTLKCKIKTMSDSVGDAGIWLAIHDRNNKIVYFDDTKNKRIANNSDWKEIELNTEIDSTATGISYGGICTGKITAWFDDFELYIDNEKYIEAPAPRTTPLSKKEIAILKNYCYPLKSIDPSFSNTNDLNVLQKLIGDAKIVALGEVSHGSSEIFKLKHRIIKYLTEHNNFNTIALEANMPESYQLNQDILQQQLEKINIWDKLHFWIYNTSEFRDMLNWMSDYNKSLPKVNLTGFDMQFYQGAVVELKKGFMNNPLLDKELDELKKLLFEVLDNYFKTEVFKPTIAQSTRVNAIISNLKSNINSTESLNNKEWLSQNIRIIEQFMDQSGMSRDKYMAENLLWILDNDKNSRIITWAHNDHILKTHKKMGEYIDEAIKEKYIAFGFTFYDGKFSGLGPKGLSPLDAETAYPGTYEYFLNEINEPYFILDLKKIKKDKPKELDWLLDTLAMRTVGANKMPIEFRNVNIGDGFDYLIFIKTSSSATQLN